SASQTVTLSNPSSEPLLITSIAASGDYTVTDTCGGSLAVGADCAISVTFTPTAAGARTGTLSITDSAAGSPQFVTLTGAGVVSFSLSPASLTFSSQVVGTTSSAQTVTLSNQGSDALNLAGITVAGDFAQANNCGSTVAAGAACAISVTMT